MALHDVIKNLPILFDEYLLRPFFGRFSRKVYGNNAGIINNFFGNLKLNSKTENQDSKDLLKNGFVKFEKIINPIQLKAIKELFIKNFLDNSFKASGDNELKNNSLMYSEQRERLIELFNAISLQTPRISSLLKNYYNCKYKVHKIFFQRNIGTSIVDDGSVNYFSNQWHNDQFMTSRLKFFIYLDDVREENGPLKIIDIKKTKEIMRGNGYSSRRNINLEIKSFLDTLDKSASIICDAGTVVFANTTKCLHRASLPKKGHYRDIFAGEFIAN
jgi:hypothetical protein